MSASWFFVVLSEAISVSRQEIRLPGVGSYIALAIEQSNLKAVLYAIITMFIVILLYDQLLFRPLIQWSEKFRGDKTSERELHYRSWLVNILKKTLFVRHVGNVFTALLEWIVNIKFLDKKAVMRQKIAYRPRSFRQFWHWSFVLLLSLAALWAAYFVFKIATLTEILHVFWLGSITCIRVIVLILLSSLLWVPIGVMIGMRPRWVERVQPIVQFVAAFPANLIYPIVVICVLKFHLNVEIWLTPLMILGTQWYILFNVIAGASQVPEALYQVADNLGLKGWRWWYRLGIPGILPYYVTGAMAAAGGAWNASIVAEWVSWGHTTLKATGLGAYIHAYTEVGDFSKIALGTLVMCVFVLGLNYCIWRPLYRLATNRFGIH